MLAVAIHGFSYNEYIGHGVCTANMQSAEAHITVDYRWLVSRGEKHLRFSLDSKITSYIVSYEPYLMEVSPLSVSNVHLVGGREQVLYPLDVGVLYLAGNVEYGHDYRDQLRDFARDRGWDPADEVYNGIRQRDPQRLFIVVRNRRFPPRYHGDRVGSLGYGANVYLTHVEDDEG